MAIENLIRKKEQAALVILIVLAVLIWFQALKPKAETLTAVILDVGQGDSIFIRTPSGKTVLVDGGGKPGDESAVIGERVVEPFLRSMGVNRIDVIVLTHMHDDHVGGLMPVARDFKVGMALCPDAPRDSLAYREFLRIIKRRRIPCRRACRGQEIDFGDGVTARILNPPDELLTNTSDDANNNSIVMRLDYGNESLLLTGDAGVEAENDMMQSGEEVHADVLKLGHHGSASATSEEWLDQVAPTAAVISVGRRNSFGHPSTEVLERLGQRGLDIYRTDRDGAITIRLSRNRAEISRYMSVRSSTQDIVRR